jgi:hypothetical protein
MRTKTLYLSALLGAVSIATSVAQTVYSVNAVGYVNVTLVPGFNMVANPLDAGAGLNTVPNLFSAMPNGSYVYKFDSSAGGYITGAKAFGRWNASATNINLIPGEGAFVKNPTATNIIITFVGEVAQGSLTNPLPSGYALVSSQVPQEDTVDALGYPKANGDKLYLWDQALQTYRTFSYAFGKWSLPAGVPTVKVGEAFFSKKVNAAPWTRTFSVNQ